MSRDIVERLLCTELEDVSGFMLGEAADEICRLRAEIEKLRKRNDELLKAIIQMHREANARTDDGEVDG